MTLGRTSSGAIKIKTDGTTRAVNCACCEGGCTCGSATPINPPDDPDFTKKLRGDDPSVSSFTQVLVTYNIIINSDWANVAGTMSGSWVDAVESWEADEFNDAYSGPCMEQVNGDWVEISKAFQGGSSCSNTELCYGNCSQRAADYSGIAEMYLYLRADGCLVAQLWEGFFGGAFYISKDCDPNELRTGDRPANAGISVSINGVNTYTLYESTYSTDTVTGFFNITFS